MPRAKTDNNSHADSGRPRPARSAKNLFDRDAMAHNLNAVDGCRSYLTLFGAVGAGVVGVCVEIKFHGAFVLNRRVVLHAIDATHAR